MPEPTRVAIVAAQNEAQAAGNDVLRPEHLVLGLLQDPDGLACRAIVAQGVALADVRAAATAALPPATAPVPSLVPFSGEAKKALELTFREALRLGHPAVGPGHILLALLEQEGDDGILTRLGIDKAKVVDTVAAGHA